MIESYIVGDRNKSNLFSDLPDGTWVASFLVENDEVWEKIKDGTFQGFSLEGYFVDKYEEELISNIENKLEKIINSDMGDNEKEMKIKQLLNIE